MRVRLTDGTNEVELEANGLSAPPLAAIEATALRILDHLRTPHPGEHPGTPDGTRPPFGFDADLDGVSLDSHTERAEPYDDGRDDQWDDEDEGEQQ